MRPRPRGSPSRPAARHGVDWRFTAGAAGRATVTATAIAGGDRDAVELGFPVLPFGLKRELGKSGSLTAAGTATATLAIPGHSNPAARTIEIGLAPSLAGSMLGALDFLTSYPYGCTEQTLSSFLPNAGRRANAGAA